MGRSLSAGPLWTRRLRSAGAQRSCSLTPGEKPRSVVYVMYYCIYRPARAFVVAVGASGVRLKYVRT